VSRKSRRKEERKLLVAALFMLLFRAFYLVLFVGQLLLEFTIAYDVPYCITDKKKSRAAGDK
jgi:hypothetical protein